MSKSSDNLIKVIFLTGAIIGLLFTLFNFRNNNGDPLINLVFAKSFRNGFFYYGNEGPKSGSTSPLMVLITIPFYLIWKEPLLIYIKIFYFLIFILAGYFLSLLVKKIFNSPIVTYITLFLFFGNIYFGYLTATLYDSILLFLLLNLFYLVLIEIYLSFKNEKEVNYSQFILLGFLGGLSILARPEAILAIAISFLWFLFLITKVDRKNYYKKFTISFLIFLMLAGGFYLILAYQTGHLIPTSVLARATLKSNGFIQVLKKLYLNRWWVYYMFFTYLVLSFFAFIKFRKIKTDFPLEPINLFFVTILIYLPIFMYSGEVRYISASFPALIILSTGFLMFFLESLKKQYNFYIQLFILSICFLFYIFVVLRIGGSLPFYSEEVIFEKELCKILNEIAKPTDKVLIYEVQAQYCLKPQTISLDGIVGGEILPYFRKRSNLVEFFERYRPSYLVVANYPLYREEYKNTIIEEIYRYNKELKTGESIKLHNITFTKIAENTNDKLKIKGMTFWESIYKVQYEI